MTVTHHPLSTPFRQARGAPRPPGRTFDCPHWSSQATVRDSVKAVRARRPPNPSPVASVTLMEETGPGHADEAAAPGTGLPPRDCRRTLASGQRSASPSGARGIRAPWTSAARDVAGQPPINFEGSTTTSWAGDMPGGRSGGAWPVPLERTEHVVQIRKRAAGPQRRRGHHYAQGQVGVTPNDQ